MTPFAAAIDTLLSGLVDDALSQLEGVPDADLNEWIPNLELADINTFYALATHLVGAGEYWLLHAAGGWPTNRNRPSEFRATGTFIELQARYRRWMDDCRQVLSTLTDADLGKIFPAGPQSDEPMTHAECVAHALEHTAVHVGHLQIQRQLWDAEHGIHRRYGED